MTELRILLEVAEAFHTPLLAAIAWVIWRLKVNEIPHLQDRLDRIDARMARMEGIKEGEELERARK